MQFVAFYPKKEGAYHVLGELEGADIIGICEGYATAATVYEIADIPVIVAWDAGNLTPVAKLIRAKYPDAKIVFGADDDWQTKKPNGDPVNPGREQATGAAGAVGGKVLYPKFTRARGPKDTDFNDLMVLQGPVAVRAQWDHLIRTLRGQGVKKAHFEEADQWRLGLRYTPTGQLSGDAANIALILQNDPAWQGVLGFNEFAARLEKRKIPPYSPSSVGEWSDIDESQTEIWLIREHGLQPKAGALARAIGVIAAENAFHPVRDYLDGLKWDRSLRLDCWLNTFLGAELTEYCVKVARKWMIGAVARIYCPGIKNDNVLILEGLQGLGKSLLLKTLAKNPEWFSDTSFKLGDREGFLAIRGKWIIEMGELDSFNKAETTAAKLFFSGSEDTYRNPYDRYARTVKRQCVFAGTTNEESYLRDPTGNRRYWPIKCHHVRIEAISSVLNQLWAEAVEAFKGGEPFHVLPEERPLFEQEQAGRVEGDVWEEKLVEYFEKYIAGNEFSALELMQSALDLRIEHIKRPEQIRLGGVMRRLGWTKKQVKRGGLVGWVFVRPQA